MTVQTNNVWKNIKAYGLSSTYLTANTSARLMVYSGVMPNASTYATAFNLATYAPQLLVGWTNFNLQRLNNVVSFGVTPPSPVNASGTGLAAWCVLCYGPTSFTTGTTSDFVIGEPSIANDNGILQLSTLDIITGTSVTPVNFNIQF